MLQRHGPNPKPRLGGKAAPPTPPKAEVQALSGGKRVLRGFGFRVGYRGF